MLASLRLFSSAEIADPAEPSSDAVIHAGIHNGIQLCEIDIEGILEIASLIDLDVFDLAEKRGRFADFNRFSNLAFIYPMRKTVNSSSNSSAP